MIGQYSVSSLSLGPHRAEICILFSSMRVYPCSLQFLLSVDDLAVSEAVWEKD